jgi:enolase
MTAFAIQSIHGRRVWDSRGRPTLEAEGTLNDGAKGLVKPWSYATVDIHLVGSMYCRL